MKGVKAFEIIIILIFTFFSLIVFFQFLIKNFLKIEEAKINIYSKKDFLFKISELIYQCFEKFKKENKKLVCFEIKYFGKEEIKKDEVLNKVSKILNTNINIKFENLVFNETVFIIYSINEIELNKVKDIAE